MDDIRRARINVIITILVTIQGQVEEIFAAEDGRFDDRTDASKSTAQGKLSQDAAYQLGQAAECMEEAIVALREAVGSQGD